MPAPLVGSRHIHSATAAQLSAGSQAQRAGSTQAAQAEPSAIIETSPGNQQWFYRLTEPVRDVSLAHFLTKQVLATPVQGHLMTDQGAKGITRLCKLPQGRNLKLALGQPWQNKMVSWRPTLAYSAWEVAAWFGQSLDHVPQINAMPAAAALLSGEHPLIEALQEAELLKSAQQKNSGWWDIQCLQRHLHTKGVDDGTAVKVRADGSWTMKCQHGHCADLKARDLYRWLVEQGSVGLVPIGSLGEGATLTADEKRALVEYMKTF